MKLTYNWLKDFIEIKIPPRALADKLTMAGLEVTSLEEKEGDFVFEIEITSNRPDWLSVIGVAREIAAITKRKLKIKNEKLKIITKTKSRCYIKIEDKNDCPLYTAIVIEGVKISPSPEWMQKRLRAIGLRPVNNVVDITNYVLYETGQPLHAFDWDRLIGRQSPVASRQSKIIVRRARNKEEIITIDGIKRSIDENMLIIAVGSDEKTGQPANRPTGQPIAIAGIIGGKDSEVNEGTKNIILESALFDPLVVRRGARQIGVSTDSSYRFERKVDPRGVISAAERAAALITELCGGKTSYKCQSVKVSKSQERKIVLSTERAEKILGIKLSALKIKQIFSSLGFKLTAQNVKRTTRVVASIPSFRQDIAAEEDLLEEIARIYGYEKIPNTLPRILPNFINPLKLKYLAGCNIDAEMTRGIRRALIGMGFSEVINYSLNPSDAPKKNKTTELINPIQIENPLSREQEILRPDLFFGLLASAARNINRKNNRLKIFELGRIFCARENEAPAEKVTLGLAVTGRVSSDWQGADKREFSFFDLKGALEQVFSRLDIEEISFKAEKSPLFKQGASFSLWLGDKPIGLIGEADAAILENYDLKQKNIFVAQVSLSDIAGYFNPKKKFKPYSPYPSIRRDISLLIKKEVPYSRIEEVISACAQEVIEQDATLLEQYSGKQVPGGFQNLLISLEYKSSSRTLKDEEVDILHKQILDKLRQELGASVR